MMKAGQERLREKMREKRELVPVCLLVFFSLLCAAALPVLAVRLGAGGEYRYARRFVPDTVTVERTDGSFAVMDLEEITARGLACYAALRGEREADTDMPSESFLPAAALRALAVALRSRASYLILHPQSESADLREAAFPLRQGDLPTVVTQAVKDTEGMVLAYEGDVIFAATHEESGGDTLAAEVLGYAGFPYLVSVKGVEEPTRLAVYLDKQTLADRIASSGQGSQRSEGEENAALGGLRREASGAVSAVLWGDAVIDGPSFAALAGLASCYFTVSESREGYLFTVSGRGSGLGMSRRGALALAEAGEDFAAILAYYYPNCRLSRPTA